MHVHPDADPDGFPYSWSLVVTDGDDSYSVAKEFYAQGTTMFTWGVFRTAPFGIVRTGFRTRREAVSHARRMLVHKHSRRR